MSRKKILVPIDIHEDSADLLFHAGSLASIIHGRISFVTVMEDSLGDFNQKNGLLLQRRIIEMELSKIVNKNFNQSKQDFDIIVTKGDYASRILQMNNDLGVDLILVNSNVLDTLKPILSQLASVFIFMQNTTAPLKQLILPVNLDTNYKQKIQDSIEIAKLLNANLKVFSYTYSNANEEIYKEQLYKIKNLIERENVACVISYNKRTSESVSFMDNLLLDLDNALPLLTIEDLEDFKLSVELQDFIHAKKFVLITSKKKFKTQKPVAKQLTYK
jgi:nucleotide-binding universal stress UspA family protein